MKSTCPNPAGAFHYYFPMVRIPGAGETAISFRQAGHRSKGPGKNRPFVLLKYNCYFL